ncbi:MAG: Dihydroanticapsin 7-dehydrogenase [Turneriella sp.]|nr:Dihydroanticapsin 7-dehydrogenase [Turneriella sp.]
MLKDKVVVITGGAGRIGSAFVKSVVEQNGIAIIADVNHVAAKMIIYKITTELAPKMENVASRIMFINLDIFSKISIQEMIDLLHEKYSRIDALVNNAYPKSKNYGKKFFDIDMQDFNEFIDLHLGGYFNISQQFIRYFLKQGHGNIINISSIQGVAAPAFETYEGTDMHSPVEYTVAKHGLIGMTKYMAKMFKKDGIRVNAISPGGILADQPQRFLDQYKARCGTKGMLDARDISGALVYLISDSSHYVNGQNIIVDDGFGL